MENNNPRWLNRKSLFAAFFIVAFLFFLYQFVTLISPFFNAFIIAIILAMIFYPLHVRISARFRSRDVGAALSVAAVSIIVIIPLMLLGWMTMRESEGVINIANGIMQQMSLGNGSFTAKLPPSVQALWAKISLQAAAFNIDIGGHVSGWLRDLGQNLAASGGRMLKNVAFLGLDLLVLVLSLFLFFRDGVNILNSALELAPMNRQHKDFILVTLYQTIIAVVRGVLLTAGAQGALAAIGYALAGVGLPTLLGAATAVAALFPLGGSALIWLPVSIYVFYSVSHGVGIFLFLWGFFVVGLTDNFLRPILIGAEAKLPVVLVFIGVIGGFRVYGLMGVLLGPVIIACMLAFVKIYRQELQHILKLEAQTEAQK